MRRILPPLVFATCALLAGCIQQSDTRSFYLHEDGAVELLLLLDNVHSSESGPKRGEEEKKWLTDFRRRATPELTQLKQASARVNEARLLRDKAPFAAVIQARLSDSKALAAFLDLSPADPKNRLELVKDSQDARKRTLVIHSHKDHGATAPAKHASDEERDAVQKLHWQFIPVGGSITASKACLISQDKRSCLLDIAEILKEDRNGGDTDVSITWRLD